MTKWEESVNFKTAEVARREMFRPPPFRNIQDLLTQPVFKKAYLDEAFLVSFATLSASRIFRQSLKNII